MWVVKGQYVRPYSEYPKLKMGIQIIVQVAKKGIRPSIPPECPPALDQLIRDVWNQDPSPRPTATELLQKLDTLEKDYKAAPDNWPKPGQVEKEGK